MIQLREERNNINYFIKGCQSLSFSEDIMAREVIRPRHRQKWECVNVVLCEVFGDKYKNEISMISALVASAKRHNKKGSQISLDENVYTKAYKLTHQRVSYTRTINLLHKMDAEGYITLYVGYWDTQEECGLPSFFTFEDKYSDLWDGIDVSSALGRKEDTVIVRDSITKEPLLTKGFRGIITIRDNLKSYNQFIADNNIEINSEKLSISYKRVFHDSLNGSGRYYTNGVFQTLKKEQRVNITINGSNTSELDYSCIHPRMLHTMIGVDVGEGWSAYKTDIVSREDAKVLMLIMLYSDSENKAIWEGSNSLHLPRETVIEAFKDLRENNRAIEHEFFSKDLWKTLQHYDSSIASLVLWKCKEKGIAALPYHDSFRVEKKYKEILRGIMFEAWREILGTTMNCRVDEK